MRPFLTLCLSFFCFTLTVLGQNMVEVTGIITDMQNEPLIGANISVSNSPGLGAISNIDGKYKIKVEQYSKLIFSYVGYEKQEVLIKDEFVINIKLKESEENILNEVVVTAAGAQEKVTVTGAITTVDIKDLKSNPTSNISNALLGNVTGVLGKQTSGEPGASTSFWIRGISTFGANTSALVLVDGFERNLDEINVEDIQNFSVLKDASATAIYGSRGANGVILITTKRGEAGKIKINVKLESKYSTLIQVPDFVDGYRYATLMNEARVTRNQEPILQADEMNILRLGLDPDLYPNVDWQKVMLKDGAMSGRAAIDLQGGGSTARYFVSGSYYDQAGIYKTDKSIKDYSTNANYRIWNYRLNTDIDITKTTILEVGVSGSLQKHNNPGTETKEIWNTLMKYNPILTPVMYSNGKVPSYGDGERTNPYIRATMSGFKEAWQNNIQTNITLKQDLRFITPGLNFIGRFGYDTYSDNSIRREKWPEQWKAEKYRNTEGQIEFKRIINEQKMFQSSSSASSRNEFLDTELNYSHDISAHNIGGTLKYTQSSKVRTQDIGNDLKKGIAFRNQALAGRATYRYQSRYFTEFNFGYTGSENFKSGHRFGFFPAVSAAWNIADEDFIKKKWGEWLSMLKIRGSWGKVGNDNLGENNRFPYLYTIDNANGYNFGDYSFNNSYNGLYYSQVASPYITWEKSTKKDVGMDFYLFGNKFSGTVDYFDEKREGIYSDRNYLSSMVGLEGGTAKANVGSVRTRGVEGNFAIQHKIDKVDITARGNFTYNKNEILDYDHEYNFYGYNSWNGYPVQQARGLIALGLFKDWDDIRNSPVQDFGSTVMPGDIKYKDVNGDGVINDDDIVPIGRTTSPSFVYGFGASASWNSFDFSVHFQGAGKSSFFINGPTVYMFNEGMWGNVLTDLANSDRWISADISGDPSTENPNAAYPRLSYGGNGNNYRPSTFWQRNGSYLRLKTLELGYRIPKQLINRIKIDNMRVYFTGTNLLTWSSFKLWDPEMNSSSGTEYPKSKTFQLGLTVNF